MDISLVIAGGLATVTAAIHIVAGHRDPVLPLLRSDLTEVSRRTLHAVWHMASTVLVLTSGFLIYIGIAQPEGRQLLTAFIAANYACYSLVFLVLTLKVDKAGRGIVQRLLTLPQWLLLLPIAVLAAVGAQ